MTCRHGMPTPTSCLDCMEDDGVGPAPTPPADFSHSFTVRYDGYCGCNLPISAGQRIVFVNGRARHEWCVDAERGQE